MCFITIVRKAWSINACLSRKNYPQVVDFDVTGLIGGIVENDMKPSERSGMVSFVSNNALSLNIAY